MAIKTYKKGSTEKLAENFRAYEFDCSCSRCKQTLIDTELVEILQKIRDHFGAKVFVTGYRCPEHNAEVANAATKSKHMLGMAADIDVEGVAPAEVAKYAESIGVPGIGLYEKKDCGSDFVHIDTRTTKSFWYGHKQAKRTTFGGAPEEKTFTLTLRQLRKGSEGDDVKALQQLLIANGENCGGKGADGIFGVNTEAALIHYQCDHSLKGDGIAGPDTMGTLLGAK